MSDSSPSAPPVPHAAAPDTQHVILPGRDIELVPSPPGSHVLMLGLCLAALGPLGGFLVGSMIGADSTSAVSPLFLSLFIGIVIGGIGLVIMTLGGMRLYRHFKGRGMTIFVD